MAYKMLPIKKLIEVESLVSVYYFEYTSDIHFHGEKHDFWELLYVDMGIVEVGANERKIFLQPGELIFHQPLEYHSLKAKGKDAVAVMVVSFVSNSPAMQAFKGMKYSLLPDEKTMLSSLLKECQECFSNSLHFSSKDGLVLSENAPTGNLQMVGNQLEILLLQLQRRQLLQMVEEDSGLAQTTIPASKPCLQRIMLYLEENVTEPLTVEKIASDNYISRSRLQALFNAEYKTGVMETFHRIKASKAKTLLRSGYGCGEVANYLGYSTPAAFGKRFKSVTGYPPQAYTKSIQSHTRYISSID